MISLHRTTGPAKDNGVHLSDFHFDLPEDRIAQSPTENREDSRLLVLHRDTGRIEHRGFRDFKEYLRSGDTLVMNNSRVIPARLRARKIEGGGRVELLLLEENQTNDWWALLRPGKRLRNGSVLQVLDLEGNPSEMNATVLDKDPRARYRVRFSGVPEIRSLLPSIGEIPLPPYIRRPAGTSQALDLERYQTVFGIHEGSVAAPTAGLHFSNGSLEAIRAMGVTTCSVTLHVGMGTFAPVKTENLAEHAMHEEQIHVDEETATTLQSARNSGSRIVAAGTTSLRTLESVARLNHGQLRAYRGRTDLFIHPPGQFHVVDILLTNFHLPGSTLLMLVSAFAAPNETRGRDLILKAYAEAIREGYRFFSYGDAMLIL
jgi:S-adenosylmethionine:tRNA ribosyltransferase-isomerase